MRSVQASVSYNDGKLAKPQLVCQDGRMPDNPIPAASLCQAAVLGLDIGTNSIGWALLSINADQQPNGLIDAGVRIFPEAVDAKTRTPLNAERRRLRQMRRQIARRAQRKALVRGILVRHGMWPAEAMNDPKPEGMLNTIGDPIQLRAEGLDRALTPHEFGRVLFHLAARRGFRSNRKGRRPETDKDDEGLVAGVEALEKLLRETGARTLGEHLYREQRAGKNHRNRRGDRKTAAGRAMIEHEFAELWKAQAAHDPKRLTPALMVALRRALFFQRPLKAPPRQVRCVWEAARGRTRQPASWAWPLAQRFRLRQELNHLRMLNPKTQELMPLDQKASDALADELERKEKLSWSGVRKILKKAMNRPVLEEERFSREDVIEHLTGNTTGVRLRKVLESDWDTLDEWLETHGSERLNKQRQQRLKEADQHKHPQSVLELAQDLLVTDLLTIGDSYALETGMDALLKRLQEDWGFDLLTAEKLAGVRLEERPGRVSLTAMRKIMPHLLTGADITSAASKAGYPRQDELKRQVVARVEAPPETRNPVVDRALAYVRELVNAILRTYGRPVAIRIEMARDLKQSKDEKLKTLKDQKRNQLLNSQANQFWKEKGVDEPNHDHRSKYRLWREMDEAIGGVCPYTGQRISASMLASEAVQVEHIIPYARCLDDSFTNKILCIADANTEKGNRTPWEWLAGDAARYQAVLDRVQRLSPGKRSRFHPPQAWRFLEESKREKFKPGDSLIDDFTSRQLNDTRHIAKVARGWLGALYASHTDDGKGQVPVQVCRGGSTALLRHVWGLNRLLSEDGAKNRADHRHHAVDAVVIACTDPGLYQRLAQVAGAWPKGERLIRVLSRLSAPWTGLGTDLSARLERMVVSHAVKRRLAGGFHEDTAYGYQGTDEKSGKLIFHYRKRLDATFKNEDEIVDPVVQERVKAHLAKHNGDPKAAFAGGDPCLHVDGKTPITTVRIRTTFSPESVMGRERNGRAVAHYRLGNNHHMELWRDANGKVQGEIVSAYAAARYVRSGDAPLYPHTNTADRTLITNLTINDTVEVPGEVAPEYYRVQKMSEGKIELRMLNAASLDNKDDHDQKSPASFIAAGYRKVFVDCLGRVHRDDQAPASAADKQLIPAPKAKAEG